MAVIRSVDVNVVHSRVELEQNHLDALMNGGNQVIRSVYLGLRANLVEKHSSIPPHATVGFNYEGLKYGVGWK